VDDKRGQHWLRGRKRPRLARGSKRARAALAALLALLAAVALVAYLYERHRTGSIYHPHARFVPQPTPTLPKRGPARFAWPLYGYDKQHTRFFPAPARVHPPFTQLWVHDEHALLSAIDKRTGRVIWKRKLGRLSASSPAVTYNTVYVTILSSGRRRNPGRVVALDSANGHIRWQRALPSPSESSPLIDRGRIFFGSQSGRVYALNDSDGKLLWSYKAAAAVKASPTLADGVLYFGDYSGHLQAISERNGRRLWISASEGALLGSGTFYSTAAVAYGRVFLGNTDGRIYAYDARSGRLDWAVQTGDYVYSSPAVTNAPGLGPTIYLGSYDGTFYAINARSGHVSWRFDAHGRISGSATILGRIVYFSDLGSHRTYGLGISTGRLLFEKNTGAFDPAVSDGDDVYITGDSSLFALAPGG